MKKGATTASFIPSRWVTFTALWALMAVVGAGGPVWAAPSGDSAKHEPTGLSIKEFGAGDPLTAITAVLTSATVSNISINGSSIQGDVDTSLVSFGVFSQGGDAIGLNSGLGMSANALVGGFAGPLSNIEDDYLFADDPDFGGSAQVNSDRRTDFDSLLSQALLSDGRCSSAQIANDGEASGGCTYNSTSLQFDIVPTERYLKFEYVYATSELGWWDGSRWRGDVIDFADAVGIFIGRGTLTSSDNVAVRPGTTQSLTAANVGIAALQSPATAVDRALEQAAAQRNLDNWRADPSGAASDFFYFSDVTVGRNITEEIDGTMLFDDDLGEVQIDIDWAIQYLTVPITVVYDAGANWATDGSLTMRIVVADVADDFNPPAVFFSGGSLRFEASERPEPASRLALDFNVDPVPTFTTSARVPVTLSRTDSSNNPISIGPAITVALDSGPVAGQFFLQQTGGSPVATVSIAEDSASADLWFEAPARGNFTITASRPSFARATLTVNVELSESEAAVAEAMQLFANIGEPGSQAPKKSDYELIGVDIGATDVEAVNSILIKLDSEQRDSALEIQRVVDVYEVIKSGAGDSISVADFNRVGIPDEGALNTAGAQLLSDVLAGLPAGEKDSYNKLAGLASTVQKIIAASAGVAVDLTAEAFAAIGVEGVRVGNLTELLSQVSATAADGSDVNTVDKLTALVASANKALSDGYAEDNITGVTENNVADINEIIEGLGNDAPTTPVGVQELVDAYIVITTGKNPDGDDADADAADYATIGVTGVDEDNVGDINEILKGLGDDAPTTAGGIQDVVDAYLVVTEGGPATEEGFELIGLGFLDTPAKINLMNSVLADKAASDINTMEKVTALATVVNAVIRLASRPTGILPEEFVLIGVAGVTTDNLSALSIAILDTPNDGSSVDSLAKLRALLDAIEGKVDEGAVEALVGYDPEDTGTAAPSSQTYGDAGIVGVSDDNLAAINNYLGKVAAGESLTAADIQKLVNAYNSILIAADGDPTTPAELTAAQYQALGLPEFELPAGVTLMNSILGALLPPDVPDYDELQDLAASVARILGLVSGVIDPDLSKEDFVDIGVSGINDDDDLDVVIEAIGATPADGTGIDTVQEIQELVDAVLGSDASFAAALQSLLDKTTPSAQDFTDAGIYGVNADNLTVVTGFVDTVKDAAGDAAVSRDAVQSVVNATNLILAAANNIGITSADLTAAQYQALGFTAVDSSQEVAVLNQLLAEPSLTVEFETAEDISDLVNVVTRLFDVATGDVDGLTAAQWAVLDDFLAGANAATLRLLNTVVAKLGPSGIADLNTVRDIATSATIIIATANGNRSSRPNLTAARYQSFGVAGVTTARQALFLNQVLGGLTEDLVDSASKLDAVAATALRILAAADGDSSAVTISAADFALIGIVGVEPDAVLGVLKLLGEADIEATAFDLQTLVDEFDVPEALPVPTLSWWALMLMMLLMLSFGWRRQQGCRN